MHFLSHYYTELPANNPLFVTALTIPDLTKGFSKTYNSILKKSTHPGDEYLFQIHTGILRHFEGDKKFHNSELFMQHTALAIQSFIKEGLKRDRLRLSVIAHLAIEILIDRRIILENEIICSQFYSAIVEANEDMLETYFEHFALGDEKRRFFANFQFFKQRQFLYLLKDLENIVFALNRMYSSVTKVEFTSDEKEKFLRALYNIDDTMRYSWKEILKG